ncbi:hypothetical protein OG474_06770 [Kribbella sp. NBC_01505]|uniref:hypothetical protein n=1 Tax=Kribbella sp. NBC_01505 TaxID=2903580 RepID=UPI00386F63FA
MRRIIATAAGALLAISVLATAPVYATTTAVKCIVNKDGARVGWAGGQFWTVKLLGETFYVNDPAVQGWTQGSSTNPGGGTIEQMQRQDLTCPGD